MQQEPKEHLALVAGELFNNLRSALDYVAFQIYLKGGGDPNAKRAKSVAFPIVTDESKWASALRANVPNSWDDASQKLLWCQPFVQFFPNDTALPALRGLGATDKHRRLNLYAANIFEVGWLAPELTDDQSLMAVMTQPGPVVRLDQPALLSAVYMHGGESGVGPFDFDKMLSWSSGVQLQQPEMPRVHFGFRSNDHCEISIDAVPSLITLIEQILKRFEHLPAPS